MPRHRLAALLLPLAAAALACSLLGAPARPSGAPLTQAAATNSAQLPTTAPSQAATAQPAATDTSAPTAAPSDTAAPQDTATAATVAGTAAATAAATAASADTPGANTGATVDPCTLVSADEAKAILGVDVGQPKAQASGGCLIADAATGQSAGIIVFALPAAQAGPFFDQYQAQLQQAKIKFDPTQLNRDVANGDMVAAVNDVVTITVGQPGFHAQRLAGVGDAAIWSWNSILALQEGTLVAARPHAILGLVVVGPSLKEGVVQPLLVPIAQRILAALPDSFTVATPQPPASGGLDPCSLMTTAEAAVLLGTPANAGTSGSGQCQFQDTATKKLSVRVFASQSPATIASLLQTASMEILIDDTATATKVAADISASSWQTAVSDMAASKAVFPGQVVKKLDGVGDAAVYSSIPVSGLRLVDVLAVHGQTLVGMRLELKTGDSAATEQLVVPLMQGILANLPATFTVSGAP